MPLHTQSQNGKLYRWHLTPHLVNSTPFIMADYTCLLNKCPIENGVNFDWAVHELNLEGECCHQWPWSFPLYTKCASGDSGTMQVQFASEFVDCCGLFLQWNQCRSVITWHWGCLWDTSPSGVPCLAASGLCLYCKQAGCQGTSWQGLY